MKNLIAYYDEQGRPHDAAGNLITDSATMPDGAKITVPLMMCDSVQRDVSGYQQGITDGRAALNDDPSGQKAFEDRISNAWRDAPQRRNAHDADDPSGREAYARRLENAWRG